MFKVFYIIYNVLVDKRRKGSIYWVYFIYIFIELCKYSVFLNVKYWFFKERNIKNNCKIFVFDF